MAYLQRINHRPSLSNLSPEEEGHLARHFDAYGAELIVDDQAVRWEHIEEVEVVVAPHVSGPAGWFVKRFLLKNQERYHVGIYFGAQEAVLPNITWESARYVVETVAFYAPQPVRYTGPEDLVKLTEI
ncbi:MAG: hypothetical protein ACOCX3_01260 [Chloroflexota bacterium]